MKKDFMHIANISYCYGIPNLDKLTSVWNNA